MVYTFANPNASENFIRNFLYFCSDLRNYSYIRLLASRAYSKVRHVNFVKMVAIRVGIYFIFMLYEMIIHNSCAATTHTYTITRIIHIGAKFLKFFLQNRAYL